VATRLRAKRVNPAEAQADQACEYRTINSGSKGHDSQDITVTETDHLHLLHENAASSTENDVVLAIRLVLPLVSIVNRNSLANAWSRSICAPRQESEA
jgi:hypothetical protein